MVKTVGNICMFFVSCAVSFLDARVIMEIRAEGDVKNQVIVGRPFTLEVFIDDVYGSVQAPIIKGLDGSPARLVGTYMSSVNGKSTARYSYNVRIDKLGIHTIGPAVVHYQQQELVSNQLQVSVVKDPGIVAHKNKENVHVSEKAFLRLMIDTETPFVGQKMGCTLRFYYQDPSMALQAISVPELSSFDIKEIGKVETGSSEIDGESYHYAQWRWDMYPTKPGEFIIPAYSADYEIPLKEKGHHVLSSLFVFMGNRVDRKRVYSNAITVKVLPLPHCNGPVHAVGSFERISIDIKPSIAKEGEGMLLTLELEGIGNLQAIAVPKLSIPDSLKYYDSNSTIIAPQYTDELPKKRFEFIIQGMKAGEYEIPPQLFTYFDIERNTYVTLHTSPLAVSIMPGLNSIKKEMVTPVAGETVVPFQEDELADINTLGQWYPTVEREPLSWWLFELLFLLPCLYIGYPILWKKWILLSGNSVRLVRKRAFKQAHKKIDDCIKNSNDKALYSIFVQLLKECDNTLNLNSIAVFLQKSDLSDELMQWDVFCEHIMHAAYAQSDSNNADELCRIAKQWLQRLEKNMQ